MSAIQRREEILAAATEVFAQHGFQATAIDKVAQAAGVSKALIYEHFSSKSELQETVLRQLLTSLFDEVAASAQTVGYELMCALAARVPVAVDADGLDS